MTDGNDLAFSTIKVIDTENKFIGQYESPGLTKREYFAAMAMGIERSQADIEFHVRCAKNLNPYNTPDKPDIPSLIEVRAMLAVKDADALIAALNR